MEPDSATPTPRPVATRGAVRRDDSVISVARGKNGSQRGAGSVRTEEGIAKLVIMDRTNGRLNIAYQHIAEMPKKYLDKFGHEIRELELTGNKIRDYCFLTDVPQLTTLILDRNNLDSHVKFPTLTTLTTLSLNHNAICNLSIFITALASSFPNLKFLSMMNNEAAPSYLNGGSYMQYQDYRHYVISQLHELRVLDDTSVKTEEREEAIRVYGNRRSSDPKKKRKRIKSKSYDFPDVFADTETGKDDTAECI